MQQTGRCQGFNRGLPAFGETRLRRARGLTRQGAFRKAAQALSSAPQAPKGEATVSLLQALHPPLTQGPNPTGPIYSLPCRSLLRIYWLVFADF
jgi:hypothetical protein